MQRNQITLQDIAARAGVSKMTVSAVLNGRTGRIFVSEVTRTRVLSLAREMGYRPNAAARALSTGRTGVVEFWAQNVDNPFFNAVFHAVRSHLLAHNLAVTLFEMTAPRPTPSEGAESSLHPYAASGWAADGLLILDYPGGEPRLEETMRARGARDLPFVTMGTYVASEADFVQVDLYAGAVDAVRHLVALGRKRVAYLVDHASYYPEEPRCRAYAEVMRSAGLEPEWMVAPDNRRATSRKFLHAHMRERGCPEALFCHNDLMAVGAHRALRDLGLRMPEDVAIAGCDGIEEIEYLDPPLTTVAQPVEEMCALACRFLHARIEDPKLAPQQQILKPQLIVRESTLITRGHGDPI
jgi:LacI family transcriptional regulator